MKAYLSEKLTENFSRWEFCVSETAARRGIDNTPGQQEWRNLEALARDILEPARKALGPLRITSGYRSKPLNEAIHGAKNSQHMVGEAVDVIPLAVPLADLYVWLYKNALYDQIIWEFGEWVHVSHKFQGPQRMDALLAYKRDGKTVYAPITADQMDAL